MKHYAGTNKHNYETIDNSDFDNEHYSYNNNNTMISRRERNRNKKKLKLVKKNKGKRYKRKESRAQTKGKVKIVIAMILVLSLGGTYGFLKIYFANHFYLGTTINCIDISGKTVEEAENYIKKETSDYVILLEGRDGVSEEIKGEDFKLKYDEDKNYIIEEIKNQQKESFWIKNFLYGKNKNVDDLIKYDEKELDNIIDNLSIFNENNIIEPKNPQLVYKNGEIQVEDEVYGNKIKKNELKEKIKEYISYKKSILNIEDENCYENPEYTKFSEKILKRKKALEKYKKSAVVYNLGTQEERIDINTMMNWIDMDDEDNSFINEDKVMEFVNEFADKYDTLGKIRNMYSTSGRNVTIKGGDYGFKINREAEKEALIDTLKNNSETSREPIYVQTGMNTIINDIENTCVEIDLTKQYLWFYKDGNIIAEGNIVSGCIANGTITPEGTYKLKYKDKDSVLVGENYRSPVSFWMPFNGNIGLHDASWRYKFGGNIYLSNGSHGCVNLPYELASCIFYNIDEGTPVICYY